MIFSQNLRWLLSPLISKTYTTEKTFLWQSHEQPGLTVLDVVEPGGFTASWSGVRTYGYILGFFVGPLHCEREISP